MNAEGAYWVWANRHNNFSEIKARPPTGWEAFIWRYRRPPTPFSDAAIINFEVARSRKIEP
jgi:hypothetical protein